VLVDAQHGIQKRTKVAVHWEAVKGKDLGPDEEGNQHIFNNTGHGW